MEAKLRPAGRADRVAQADQSQTSSLRAVSVDFGDVCLPEFIRDRKSLNSEPTAARGTGESLGRGTELKPLNAVPCKRERDNDRKSHDKHCGADREDHRVDYGGHSHEDRL